MLEESVDSMEEEDGSPQWIRYLTNEIRLSLFNLSGCLNAIYYTVIIFAE